MKSLSYLLVLLAVLSILAITSAVNPVLEQRQGEVIDTTPSVEDCASSPDCMSAAIWWFDCQRAHIIGQPSDPSSNVRSCLCPPGRAVPSHIDWYSKLHSCIVCVEMAIGKQSADSPLYLQIEQLAGSPNSKVGYCHGTLSTQEFVKKTKDLVKAKEFPLELPEAVLRPQGRHTVRAATPIGGIILDDMDSFIAFPMSSALTHPESTQIERSSTPTAVPNDQFSTFSAVPLESLLASTETAIPTAIFNSEFATFSAVPMESFLASIATATPTAVFNSEFSTFSAVPMESFLASLSTAIPLPSSTNIDCSNDHVGEFDTHPYNATEKSCDHDNCFRQAVRSGSAVATFCATYTKTSNTAPNGIPSYLSLCDNSPARISSACSCLDTHTSTISSASLASSTSYSAPLPTLVLVPEAFEWASLPVSPEVSACARSTDCLRASEIFITCAAEEKKRGGNVKFCFCNTNHKDRWTTSLSTCATCIAKSLPASPPSTAPASRELMVGIVDMTASIYCEPASHGSIERLQMAGRLITAYLQSPVKFFDMSLVPEASPVSNGDAFACFAEI
ncbi:hypothetical protein VTL71DRAFT_2794 [Oculimacula yallundae]|uniref:Uncharacterized protein n=1 Tax=Oculimacula yallundae TaxID=86028 RepID=A0ABR4CB24_9HELO